MKTEVLYLHESVSNSTLTAYIQDLFLDDRPMGRRPAVIICPGGAYLSISEKEAEPVALRFLSAGYHAFILRYSIGAGMARFPAPFTDAAEAVLILRKNAESWSIDPEKVCLCGFSTGAQVAAILGATWQEEYLEKALNVNKHMFKPNALLLGYPLLDMYDFRIKNAEKSHEMKALLDMVFTSVYGTVNPGKQLLDEWNCINRITSNMPPTFLWTTSEDALVDVGQGLNFIKALAAKKIPYEFHIFEKGAHGLSLGDQTAGYSDDDIKKQGNTNIWMELALKWLKSSQGF